MRTFHELVVVVLQRRALLSHLCCSTCTQGCIGLSCGGVGLTFVGLGYRAEPRNARRVASRCVLAHAVLCRPAKRQAATPSLPRTPLWWWAGPPDQPQRKRQTGGV